MMTGPVFADKMTPNFASYLWESRLVVAVFNDLDDHNHSDLTRAINDFQKAYLCENAARNLAFLAFHQDALPDDAPAVMRQKSGLFLIGHDGGIKAHSQDDNLLSSLHSIIDGMPIRQSEMAQDPICD
ncbi:MAG: hypothetical protein ACON4G_00550 [Candidatus Puniceispirillaceae bacterium]